MWRSLLDSENCTRGLNRVRSWFNKKTFVARTFRGVLMGVIINSSIGEICAYKLIQQDIHAGHLPIHTNDVAIMTLSVFEAIVAPLISWLGFRRRRAVLIGYTALITLTMLSWFVMPGPGRREESELCDLGNAANDTSFLGVPHKTVIRLVIIIFSCIIFILSRVAVWSHGVAYSDEFAPERTSVHFGILIISRAMPLILGYRALALTMDRNMTLQVSLLFFGLIPNLLQLFIIMPKTVPVVDGVQKTALPLEGRGFIQSIDRVCRNSLAMKQVVAMGLLSAALYGYLYNEIDIVKVKYNLLSEYSGTGDFAEFIQYYYIVAVMVFAGTLVSVPMLMEYRSVDAIRQVIRMTFFALFLLLITTLTIKCKHGEVAGLGSDNYGNPECSVSCGCKARMNEFEPVCAVDTMTTFVSPCQAGCMGSEILNGVKAYTNCKCSSSGRAVAGACSDSLCRDSHRLHSMMLIVIVTFTLLAIQAQGVLLLRVVDPRDKSVVMGMMWSMLALMTFVCGHLIFLGIRVISCRWFDAGQCQLQNTRFPYLVGGTSSALMLLSFLISIASWWSIRRENKRNEVIDMTQF